MSVSVTVAGTSYTIPTVGEVSWGPVVTSWIQAISAVTLQNTGGAFTLTGDLNFGTNFGVLSKYFTSVSSGAAQTGAFRLANLDSINWRNIGNTADLSLKPDADGILQYNGVDLVTLSATQTLTNKTLGSTNTVTGIKMASWTPDGTHTLTVPTATDTLALLAAAQTLTNKTLGSSNTATGITMASWTPDGTHTLTAPSATDTLALLAAAQTLTNKTIAAGSNTVTGLTNSNLSGSAGITNANLNTMSALTLKANLTGGAATPTDSTLSAVIDACIGNTQGNILFRNSSTWTVLAPGTSGFALTTGGASANPSWTSVLSNPMSAAGQMVYGSTSGTPTAVAAGTSGQVLVSAGTSAPVFTTLKAPTMQILTNGTAATYTTPTGCTLIKVTCIGGGGAGGGTSATSTGQCAAGSGGGGGGTAIKWIASPASTYTYTVSNTGVLGVSGGGGNTGATTTFSGSSLSCGGGAGGANSAAGGGPIFGAGAGGIGGTATGGDINIIGGRGGSGFILGSAQFAVGGGGGTFLAPTYPSGNTTLGQGIPGAPYGQGGGGAGAAASTASTQAGGAGGAGIIIVEEFYQ